MQVHVDAGGDESGSVDSVKLRVVSHSVHDCILDVGYSAHA